MTYQKGQTSPEIEAKSDDITKSIIEKTRLIKEASKHKSISEHIPLNEAKTRLNLLDVHSWESKELKIIKYSYNAANTKKNKMYLADLKSAIIQFNEELPNKKICTTEEQFEDSNSGYKTRAQLELEAKELKNKNKILDKQVIELFRAYLQLDHFIRQNGFENKQYHELLKLHSQTNNRFLRTVK
jgi:hypothetical protein